MSHKVIIFILCIVCCIGIAFWVWYELVLPKPVEREMLEGYSLEITEGSLTPSGCHIIIKDDTYSKGLWFDSYNYYTIDVYKAGKWRELPMLKGKEDAGKNIIDYESSNVPQSQLEFIYKALGEENKKVEYVDMDIKWEVLYGKLKKGKYRLVKWRSDYNPTKYFCATFSID